MNKYDRLIILFILLLVFGEYGAGLQPVRIFTVLLFPFVLTDRQPLRQINSYYIPFFFIWVLYSVCSLLNSPDIASGVKAIAFMVIHMISIIDLLWLGLKANAPHKAILWGWTLLLLATAPIAFYELGTDYHLPISRQESDLTMRYGHSYQERKFASVTFGNLNCYNTILCLILPFTLLGRLFFTEGKRKLELGSILIIALCATLILLNNSRGASLTLLLGLLLFVLVFIKKGVGNKVLMILVLFFGVLGIGAFGASYLELLFTRFQEQGFDDPGRMENMVKGWQAFNDSNWLGIGIGNYASVMGFRYAVDIPAPHNLWLEILVTSGIFIFIGFIGLLLSALHKSKSANNLYSCAAVKLLILILIPASVINSNYLSLPALWLFLGSILLFSYNPNNNNNENNKNNVEDLLTSETL